jgi:hypothetical protein
MGETVGGADRYHLLQTQAVQGADDGTALAIQTVGHDHAEVETKREEFLDDRHGELRRGLRDIAGLAAGRGREDAEKSRGNGVVSRTP